MKTEAHVSEEPLGFDPSVVVRRLRTVEGAGLGQPTGDRGYVGESADLVARVLSMIGTVADALDMQAFAHPEVVAMSDEELGAVYRVLSRDREVICQHRAVAPAGDCLADGEAWPCAVARTLVARYL